MASRRNNRRRKNQKNWKNWKDPRVGDMALWIMTPFGVLMPSKRPEKLLKDGDDRTLQVRARRREYLDAFREFFCPELGANEHTPTQDYQWKAPVTPEALARAVAHMVLLTDSEKFKPLTEDSRYRLKDPKLAGALHGMYTRLWSAQLGYGDGTSSFDHASTKHVPQGITECVRLGHWWPAGKALCIDCGTPRPEGSDISKSGPKARPTPAEEAAWLKANPAGSAWNKPAAAVAGGSGSTAGWYSQLKEKYQQQAEMANDLGSCAKWGHDWPAHSLRCTYCDEPRPDGADDDQHVTSDSHGALYVDGAQVTEPGDTELDMPDPADLDGAQHCEAYGHEWVAGDEYCDWCGEHRPEDWPLDVDLTSDPDGNYYVEGILTTMDELLGTEETETSPGKGPGEMAATAAENEESANA